MEITPTSCRDELQTKPQTPVRGRGVAPPSLAAGQAAAVPRGQAGKSRPSRRRDMAGTRGDEQCWGQGVIQSHFEPWKGLFGVECEHREGGTASLCPAVGLPGWFGDRDMESEEGWSTQPRQGSGVHFPVPRVVPGPGRWSTSGERGGGQRTRSRQLLPSPAAPGAAAAVAQRGHQVQQRGAFPAGINAGARPGLPEL